MPSQQQRAVKKVGESLVDLMPIPCGAFVGAVTDWVREIFLRRQGENESSDVDDDTNVGIILFPAAVSINKLHQVSLEPKVIRHVSNVQSTFANLFA